MRDVTIIEEFKRLNNLLNMLANHFQLSATGAALFDEAMKNLLLKKGLITETELREQLGEEIRKANEPKAAETAPEAPPVSEVLVTPTPAEIAKIEDTKAL